MENYHLIQNVISSYTNAVNRRDWKAVSEVFAEDAVWEATGLPDARYDGREAIITGIAAMVDTTATLTQVNTPSVITVEGTTAKAQCTIRETGFLKAAKIRFEALGSYEDELVLLDGRWRFKYRNFVLWENWQLPVA